MCQFIETILVKDGEMCNLHYHNIRLNRTILHFSKDRPEKLDIESIVSAKLNTILEQNPDLKIGNCKLRLLYSTDKIEEITLSPYLIREVKTLKCVYNDSIDYSYKSADRTAINVAYNQREGCDEVLIIRNGLVTDTSIANVAFYDGSQWVTPLQPLLKGTQRAYLLENDTIIEKAISIEMLNNFTKIRLFNALIEWGKIEIENMNQLYV